MSRRTVIVIVIVCLSVLLLACIVVGTIYALAGGRLKQRYDRRHPQKGTPAAVTQPFHVLMGPSGPVAADSTRREQCGRYVKTPELASVAADSRRPRRTAARMRPLHKKRGP